MQRCQRRIPLPPRIDRIDPVHDRVIFKPYIDIMEKNKTEIVLVPNASSLDIDDI